MSYAYRPLQMTLCDEALATSATTLMDVIRTAAQTVSPEDRSSFSSVAKELRGVCRELREIADLLLPSLTLHPLSGQMKPQGEMFHGFGGGLPDSLESLTEKLVAASTRFRGLRKLSITVPMQQDNAYLSVPLLSQAVAQMRSIVGLDTKLPFKILKVTDNPYFQQSDNNLDQCLALGVIISTNMPCLMEIELDKVSGIAPGFFETIALGCPQLRQLKLYDSSLLPEAEVSKRSHESNRAASFDENLTL